MWVLASGLPGKSFSCLSYLWPFPLQVIVQNYNSVLTLSHLYRSSDALLVHENDAVHKICAKLMNIKQISFCDINQVLAHQLGSVFQPTYSGEGSFHYRRNPLGICAPVGYLWRSLMLWKPQSCSSLALPSTWRYTHISLTSEPSTYSILQDLFSSFFFFPSLFLKIILRYNSHTIQLTHLKYARQCFLTYSQSCITIIFIIVQ